MRILIREVVRTAGGTAENRESTYNGDAVSIGRATDQVLQLADRSLALSHSEMRFDGKHLAIRAVGDGQMFINGKRSRGDRLNVGDEIEIGGYTLTIREPGGDFDAAVDFEAGELAEGDDFFGGDFRQSLEQTRLSKRGASWVLMALVLLGFLVIPSLGMFDAELGQQLRDAPVLDDGVWDSGPLHPSHHYMGENCTFCHVEPFAMVKDEQCIACHATTEHHVDPDVHQIPEFEEQRCASCHKEHYEPSVLARADQEMCSDCHSDLAAHTSGELAVLDAGDFGDDHPEFRVSLLRNTGLGDDMSWHIERHALDIPGLQEDSNLLFPHDVHLDMAGIDGPEGEVVMQCSDCHRLEAGGAYLKPVTMEQHCADCHLLTFDSTVPDRVLPHGEPDLILRLLEEFYARQLIFGADVPPPVAGAEPAQPQRQARRPGQPRMRTLQLAPVSPAELAGPDGAQIIENARRRAAQTAEDIFERTTCKICHEVDRVDDPSRVSPWQVQPVRLAQVWMPKSWFDHASHANEECSSCHAAETSDLASDILMPDIDSCRDCHAGEDADDRLGSTCVMCHTFHLPGLGPMRPDEPGSVSRMEQTDLDRMRGDRIDELTPMRTN